MTAFIEGEIGAGPSASIRSKRPPPSGVLLAIVAIALVATAIAFGAVRWSRPVGSNLRTDAEVALASTVSIRGFGCGLVPRGGAGVVVGDRLVMTDAHVVAGSTHLELTLGSRRTSGTVVHLDPRLDLALVQLNPAFGSTQQQIVPLAAAVKGAVGTVAILRNDILRSMKISVLRPVTITTEDIYVQGKVTRAGYELLASTRPGDSGAPVITHGRVAALLWSRSQRSDSRAWATDVTVLRPQIGSARLRSIPSDTRCR